LLFCFEARTYMLHSELKWIKYFGLFLSFCLGSQIPRQIKWEKFADMIFFLSSSFYFFSFNSMHLIFPGGVIFSRPLLPVVETRDVQESRALTRVCPSSSLLQAESWQILNIIEKFQKR